jgi:tetratricopeptide (TPR) repeat protein
LRAGQAVSAEELCRDCPDLLTEVQEGLELMRLGERLCGEDPDPWQAGTTLTASATFQVQRQINGGGQGELFLVHDETLERQVVLKRPSRSRWTERPGQFEREATITGRLEHASVAPVHALGRDRANQTFYAMRYLSGPTLAEEIDRYHEEQDAVGQRLALQRLMQSFLAVCQVIAYAHSRGILHRDIKPDNIKVGDFGETWVLDWGLAGEVEQPQNVPGGTPGYMAPEQAARQWDRVGFASDVYSLGATLYTVLTNQVPPAAGPAAGDPLAQAARRRSPTDLRPLVAICRRAMQRDSAHRYPNAQALAQEVVRWQADERVEAFGPEPWDYWIARQVRRHRTASIVAVAVLVVAAVSLGVMWLAVSAEQKRTEQQRLQAVAHATEARAQSARAQANFNIAFRAVDDTVTRLGRSRDLVDVPATEKLSAEQPVALQRFQVARREVLEFALEWFQALLHEQPDDPEARRRIARAYQRVGDIQQDLGRQAEAIRAYQKGLQLLHGLAAEFPDQPEHRHRAALSENGIGKALRRTGRSAEAAKAYARALQTWEKLEADYPARPKYRHYRGIVHLNLSVLYEHRGRLPRAEESFRRAGQIQRELSRRFPENAEYQDDCALALQGAARVCTRRNNPAGARPLLEEAIRRWRTAVRLEPKDARYRLSLASAHNDLAAALVGLGRYDDAMETAVDLTRSLPDTWDASYLSARLLAACLVEAERDPRLNAAQRKAIAKRSIRLTVPMLRRALDQGGAQVPDLKSAIDFIHLHARDDFKELLARQARQRAVSP